MTELINKNPHVLDESQLPFRIEDTDNLLNSTISKNSLLKKKQISKFCSLDSQVIQELEIFDKLMLIGLSKSHAISDQVYEANTQSSASEIDELEDPIDAQEIYDLIAHISDPEHPLTLGQLSVVNLTDIEVLGNNDINTIAEVIVKITPTIKHCSLATLIGLGIRVRLERSLPPRYRITVLLKEGNHQSETQVNKQLNDKERVSAACENERLVEVVSKMLSTCK